jgi:putative colanic acid biosynthesis acetyltransferase WcaF
MKPSETGINKATDLSAYHNFWYSPGAPVLRRLLWYLVNALFINSYWLPASGFKVLLLKFFGAKVGRGVTIKPGVNIKYPWLLEIGDYCWIGEGVWIDNLTRVKIGASACISQGAMLLTGNHNYKRTTFDLMIGEIELEDGVWIGAKAVVCPGITCKSHSVLSVGSVATRDLDPYIIYQGNPAVAIKSRIIS